MAARMIKAGGPLMSPCRHSPIAVLLVFAALRVCAAQPVSFEPNMSKILLTERNLRDLCRCRADCQVLTLCRGILYLA